MRILIADDHAIVRTGMMYMIKDRLNVSGMFEAGDVDEIEAVLRKEHIDLIICDINMPGCDNLKIVDTIKALAPDIRILMFSAYNEELYGWRYIKAGAHGYVNKESSEEEILKAITMVAARRVYLSQGLQQHLLDTASGKDSSPVDSLSVRELDIARLVAKGKSLKEISYTLNLHVSSVSTYKRRLFDKLNIDNIADLITLLANDNTDKNDTL